MWIRQLRISPVEKLVYDESTRCIIYGPSKKLSIDNIFYFQLIYFCESNWFHLIFSCSLKFKNGLHRYGLLIFLLDISLIWVQTPQNITGLSNRINLFVKYFWICCLNSWKNKWMGKTHAVIPMCSPSSKPIDLGFDQLHSLMLTISIWMNLKFLHSK